MKTKEYIKGYLMGLNVALSDIYNTTTNKEIKEKIFRIIKKNREIYN